MRYSQTVLTIVALLSSTVLVNANPLNHLNTAYRMARNTQEQGQADLTAMIWPFLSTGCQSALSETFKPDSSLGQCLRLTDAQSALSQTNGELTADSAGKILKSVCSNSPCSDETLGLAIQSIGLGCSAEFAMFGIDTSLLQQSLLMYKALRDIGCLKTTKPYGASGTSSAGFCLTSLYQQYSAALNADPSIFTTLQTQFAAAFQGGDEAVYAAVLSSIASVTCVECVFAILDVLEVAYPSLQSLALSETATLNGWLEGTCKDTGLAIQTDGKLPDTVIETALQPQTNALSQALGMNDKVAEAQGALKRR